MAWRWGWEQVLHFMIGTRYLVSGFWLRAGSGQLAATREKNKYIIFAISYIRKRGNFSRTYGTDVTKAGKVAGRWGASRVAGFGKKDQGRSSGQDPVDGCGEGARNQVRKFDLRWQIRMKFGNGVVLRVLFLVLVAKMMRNRAGPRIRGKQDGRHPENHQLAPQRQRFPDATG
jgi:hypothetical protein